MSPVTMQVPEAIALAEYTSTERTPVGRGRELGAAFKSEMTRISSLYQEFYHDACIALEQQQATAQQCASATREWYPELAAEQEAMAAAAGLDLSDIMAVAARTEILTNEPAVAAADHPLRTQGLQGECSTAVMLPPNGAVPETLQTWDWHKKLVPTALIWTYQADSGLTVTTFTEFCAPAKIGVNSAGLGVHFNILHHASDTPKGAVPVHALARRILDEATTITGAIEIARSAPVSASTALTIVSSEPDACTIELSPAGIGLIRPGSISVSNRVLIRTNHFLDTRLTNGERTPDVSTTRVRYDHLTFHAPSAFHLDPPKRAHALAGAQNSQSPICLSADLDQPETDQWTTMLTIAINTETHSIACVPGSPTEFRNFYTTVSADPQIAHSA